MAAETAAGVATRKQDAVEYVFCAVFAVVAALSWAALTLAELRAFSTPVLVLLTFALLAAVATWARRARPARPAAGLLALLWILALGATGATLLRPVQALVDGTDEDVYRHLGSLIAHRGGLAVDDPLLSSTPPRDWRALLALEQHWPHRLNRFRGGIQVAPGNPRLEPNFLHLLPALIAALLSIGGPAAAPLAAPLLALLSPVALFLAARRLFTTDAALAASALLVTNTAQVWAGRLPLSEVPGQFFVVSGLFFLVWWLSDRHALPALLAGIAFGLAASCRLDTMILIIPFVATVLAVDRYRGGGAHWRVVTLALALLVLQAVLHAFTVSRPYPLRLFRHTVHDESLAALAALMAGVNVVLGLIVLARLSGRRPPLWAVARTGQVAAVAIVAWLLWRIGPGIGTHHLVLVLTPVGAILACLGVIRLAARNDLRLALVAALLLASSLAYVESARNKPELPGVVRRDIPVLLPLSLLASTALLFPAGAHPVRRLIGAGVTVWLILAGGAHLLVVRQESGGAETARALSDLAAALPRDSLVVLGPGLPSHLDLALDFTFDRTSLASRQSHAGAVALRAAIARALDRRTPVFVIARNGPEVPTTGAKALAGLAVDPKLTATVPVDALRPTMGGWPAAVDRVVYPLSVYQVRNISSLPWRVDIGGQDYGVLGDGWLDREVLLGASGRWTSGGSTEVAIPRLQCADQGALLLRVRLASLRPEGTAQPPVRVAVDGQDVGALTPGDSSFRVYAFPLSPAVTRQVCHAPAAMTLSAPQFVPRRDAGLADDRQLGVAVDWLEIGVPPVGVTQ